MPEFLRMPEVATGSASARLAEWLIAEKQEYTPDDSLATIETDKAVVDFTPDADGTLLRHLVTAGTDVAVGEPIALVAAPGETVADIDAAVATLAASAPPSGPRSDGEQDSEQASTTAGSAPPTNEAGVVRAARIFTSPLARRLAAEAGIPVELITGTGPQGRIVRADVERMIAERTTAEDTQPHAVATRMTASVDTGSKRAATSPSGGPPTAGFREVAHTRMRRAIAERLTASTQAIPHFTVSGSAKIDELLLLRAQLNQASSLKVSVNDLVLKAVGYAHRQVPEANVTWTDDAMRHYNDVDVGIAVATDGGLVTPVIRAVNQLSVGTVAEITSDFAQRARSGRLREHETQGGSITVSNLGMFGLEQFSAIINPPQAAILAVGAARFEPTASASGDVVVARVLRVTLSVDHRAIDGALAARWMASFLEILEHPVQLLR